MDNNVKEIQTYLAFIADFVNNIPQLVPDGIMGETTKTAVRMFQKDYFLPETGEVTPVTWNKIVEVYAFYKSEEPSMLCPFKNGELQKKSIPVLNHMLEHISRKFDNIPAEPLEAIRKIQKLSGIPESDRVDCQTWNRIHSLYNITLH
jgi:peptidoglycan hydrolase-like protein with peptidoglycan-binding domain